MAEEESLLERILDGEEKPADLSLELLQKITDRFSKERKIGQGGFGAVYKGLFRERTVAVKRIYVNLEKIDIDDKLYDREFNNLWKINHENVVRFLGFCSNTCKKSIEKDGSMILADVRERLFCFEYISGGSLDKHITDELRGLEWETRYKIITGICKGLCYLHGKRIIHMDLKPANILLDIDNHMVPKITDFGLSRSNTNSHTVAQPIGTLGYIAPEYRDARRTIEACDIYSLGGIIMELVTGGMEVPDKHNVLRRWRQRWNNPPTPLQYQQVTRCVDIAVCCREQDPKARPSMKKIIDMLSESTDGHTGQEICSYMDDDMLGIEPLDLYLSSEVNKEMSWSVKLTNKTKTCFAFYIERPSQKYIIRQEKGIVPPEYNEYLVQITLQPQEKAPRVTQNADTLVVRSRTVRNGYKVDDITEHIFHEEAGKVVDNVNLVVVYEPTKPLKNYKNREDTNIPAEEVPEAKKRKISTSASEKGKNKLGSGDKSEAASMDIDSRGKGQPIGQTEQYNLHTLQSFSRHYPTNMRYLWKESDRAVDFKRGSMGSLLDKLGKLVTENYSLETRIRADIESFSDDLTKIHLLLLKLEHIYGAKILVNQARELSYNVEDMVDSFLVQVEPDTTKSGFRELTHEGLKFLVNGMQTHPQIDDVIRDIKKQVQAVANRQKKYNFDVNNVVANTTAKSPIATRISAIYIKAEQLIGIEAPRDELITLFEGDGSKQNLKIVSIVGLGGLGKTTLAKAVYDKFQEHTRAFVQVGQNPEAKNVLKIILSKLGKNFYEENLDELQLIEELNKFLQNKRYFIVIDDVWECSSWDIINSAFPTNHCGSRVITTTRNHDVALSCCKHEIKYVYKIKPLNKEDSELLFYRRTFGPENDCPPTRRKEKISLDILKRCGGMPLAINSIAGLLARKSDTIWENVWKSLGALTEVKAEGNTALHNMKQILDLSYIYLPDHLKTCLLYVCKYPEDREIDKNDLLRQWVAEGFVSITGRLDAEDDAENYFGSLMDMCMIQPENIDYNNEVLSCRVHDLILDLLRSKSSEVNFIQVFDGLKDETIAHGEIHRVSVQYNDKEDCSVLAQIKGSLEHVRSVLLYRGSLLPYFLKYNYIRVLHLENERYGEGLMDLTSISKLFLLRYLKISGNWFNLPNQIGQLQQLETIDIDGGRLKTYPSDIVSLPRLTHLVYDTTGIALPDGIGRLKSLRTLEGVCVYKSSVDNLKGLGELTNLSKLQLCSREFDQTEEAIPMRMDALRSSILRLSTSLRILNVGAAHYSQEVPWRSIVLDVPSWSSTLIPRESYIRELDLRCCNFQSCPEWIGQLHDLISLSIRVRQVADSFRIVAGLPALAYFHFRICAEEEQKESVVIMSGGGAFKTLKHLSLDCRNTKPPLTFEEGALPKLEKIDMLFSLHMRPSFLVPVGIQHLPALTLKKITLNVDRYDWKVVVTVDMLLEHTGKLKAMLERAFKLHHPDAAIYIDFADDHA